MKAVDRQMEVFEGAISRIDVSIIESVAEKMQSGAGISQTKKRNLARIAMLAAAAVLIGCIMGGTFFLIQKEVERHDRKQSFASFLESLKNSSGEEGTVAEERWIPIWNQIADYMKIYSSEAGIIGQEEPTEYDQVSYNSAEILRNYIGEVVVRQDGTWYQIKDYQGIRYLILESEDGDLSLWQFMLFCGEQTDALKVLFQEQFPNAKSAPYLYDDVLSLIYHVTSAENIQRIEISPIRLLMDEIPTVSIDDPETISQVYRILRNMNCTGMCSEFGGFVDTPAVRRELEGVLSPSWKRFRRVVRIFLSDGRIIDNLQYYGERGSFYDYTAYGTLSDSDRLFIDQLAGIPQE